MTKATKPAETAHQHPGEVLGSEFLGPRGISPETLAKAIAPHRT